MNNNYLFLDEVGILSKGSIMNDGNRGITFEQIEKIASEMLVQGVKPTVRGVIAVSGGKTAVVSKYLRDFFEKRDGVVSSMADEIGSGTIAKLIASEMQVIVEKRTAELAQINIRQKEQIDEYVELLEEEVKQSENARLESKQAVESAQREASEKIEKISLEASNKIQKAKESQEAAIELQKSLEKEISEVKLISENTIQAAKEQAQALVDAANSRLQESQQETKLLREQVKSLSVDEATRDIEKAQLEKNKQLLEGLRLEYAELNTEVVRYTAEKSALSKDVLRLESDNNRYKDLERELFKYQTEVVESQKQITDINSKLALLQRERDSFATALSQNKTNRE